MYLNDRSRVFLLLSLFVCLILIISGGLTIFPFSPFQSSTEKTIAQRWELLPGAGAPLPAAGGESLGRAAWVSTPLLFLLPPSPSLLGSGLFQVQKSTKLPHRKVGPGRSQICSCPETDRQDGSLDSPKLKFSLSRTFPGF